MKTPNELTAAAAATLNHTFAADSTTAGAGTTEKVTITQVDTLLKTTIIPATNLTGVIGSLPAASQEGRLYLPSDDPCLQRDTGAAWGVWGSLMKMTPVIDANYSWVNQGSSSIATNGSTVFLTGAPGAGSSSLRQRVKTAPGTPYTITVAMRMVYLMSTNYWTAGILVRDSGTSKIVSICVNCNPIGTGNFLNVTNWTNSTAFSSNPGNFAIQPPDLVWLRINDTGTNLIYSYSIDGINWIVAYTASRTVFLATPNQVGFFNLTSSTTLSAYTSFLSWLETT